jgi:DUF971 family protein
MADAPKGRLLPLLGPDPNSPRDVHLVGRYALGVEWQDGHSSIYPFDYLRGECPCGECRERAAAGPSSLPEPQTWPIEINKAGSGLRVRWQDEHLTTFEGARLRALCRCAACATQSR